MGLRGPLARAVLPRRECAWASGAGMMGRREALLRPGRKEVFDEAFFLYFEDIDLCRRVKREGWQVHHAPEVTLVHAGGAAAERHAIPAMLAYRASQLRFYGKHFGKLPCIALSTYLQCKVVACALPWRLKAAWAASRGRDAAPALLWVAAFRKVGALCKSCEKSPPVHETENASGP